MEKGTLVLKFAEGLIDREKYMRLKKLAGKDLDNCHFLVRSVGKESIHELEEMITAASLFIDLNAMTIISSDISAVTAMKKICVAAKNMILGYKTVADYGEGKEEFDCTLSIITPSAHIHIPSGFNDKKTERYVVKCLNEAMRLHEAGESGYLIYYDSYTDRIISESKDDYVRRKYFDSGAVSVSDEKGTAAKNL